MCQVYSIKSPLKLMVNNKEATMVNVKALLSSGLLSLLLSSVPVFISMHPDVTIQSAYANEQSTKRVPALRNKVYSQLARAQKLADDGDAAAGLEALDAVKKRASSMNDYERAMMYNFYGFIHYNNKALDKAMAAFEHVVNIDAIPDSLLHSTLFSLAQLSMAREEYAGALGFLERYKKAKPSDLNDAFYMLEAQAYYQNKEYKKALKSINALYQLSTEKNLPLKENWLVLERAVHYALGDQKAVTQVLERMVMRFNKPEYWVQLGAMYGEIGQEEKQLATLEAAYQQGYITKKSDITLLAQVYLYNALPYQSAKLLAQAQRKQVIDETPKTHAFIAEAYAQANEFKEAIEHFKSAAKNTEHGQFDQRLAELYINTEQYDEAADSARAALKKGGMADESQSYIALGMAQYHLAHFDAAILAFEQAEKHAKAKRLAKQWIKYVKSEKQTAEILKTALL